MGTVQWLLAALFILYLLFPQFFLRARPLDNALTVAIKRRLEAVGLRARGFYAVEDRKLNCYTLPGRRIFFTSGLLADLDEDQIYAVVLHELGHMEKRHLLFRIPLLAVYAYVIVLPLSLAYGLYQVGLLWSLIGLGVWAVWYLAFIRLIAPTVSRKIIRQELEADDFVAEHGMADSMAVALEKIQEKGVKPDSALLKAISLFWRFLLGPHPTHPPVEKRVERLRLRL